MNVALSPGASLTLNDERGRRFLSDDPGFACTVQQGGVLLCLRIPTDQADQSVFKVSAAQRAASDDDCFANSNPHL
jgi:hypothetical protein